MILKTLGSAVLFALPLIFFSGCLKEWYEGNNQNGIVKTPVKEYEIEFYKTPHNGGLQRGIYHFYYQITDIESNRKYYYIRELPLGLDYKWGYRYTIDGYIPNTQDYEYFEKFKVVSSEKVFEDFIIDIKLLHYIDGFVENIEKQSDGFYIALNDLNFYIFDEELEKRFDSLLVDSHSLLLQFGFKEDGKVFLKDILEKEYTPFSISNFNPYQDNISEPYLQRVSKNRYSLAYKNYDPIRFQVYYEDQKDKLEELLKSEDNVTLTFNFEDNGTIYLQEILEK